MTTQTIEITTVPQLKAAIKKATSVFVQPRFGCSEAWVKVAKIEVADLVASLASDSTPEDAEMYTGCFGTLTPGMVLYLG